jgi:hypothetical protein
MKARPPEAGPGSELAGEGGSTRPGSPARVWPMAPQPEVPVLSAGSRSDSARRKSVPTALNLTPATDGSCDGRTRRPRDASLQPNACLP